MSSKTNSTFSITNTTDGSSVPPELPFRDMKESVLGGEYELSLVFITDNRSAKLNEKYRDKDGPTNVLSFPLNDETGEIFINVDAVQREHDDFEKTPKSFIAYLFIHALLHLKGYNHGSKMKQQERRLQKKFDLL